MASKLYKKTQKYLSSKRSPIAKHTKRGYKIVKKKVQSFARRAGRHVSKYGKKHYPHVKESVRDYLYAAKQEHSRLPTAEDIYFNRTIKPSRSGVIRKKLHRDHIKIKNKYGGRFLYTKKKGFHRVKKPNFPSSVAYDPELNLYYFKTRKSTRKKHRHSYRYSRPLPKRKKKRRSSSNTGYFGGLPRTIVDQI